MPCSALSAVALFASARCCFVTASLQEGGRGKGERGSKGTRGSKGEEELNLKKITPKLERGAALPKKLEEAELSRTGGGSYRTRGSRASHTRAASRMSLKALIWLSWPTN